MNEEQKVIDYIARVESLGGMLRIERMSAPGTFVVMCLGVPLPHDLTQEGMAMADSIVRYLRKKTGALAQNCTALP